MNHQTKDLIRILVTHFTLCFALIHVSVAVGQQSSSDFKYRRSSLHRVIINPNTIPDKEKVLDYYFNGPFPDKYNDHTIDTKTIEVNVQSGGGKKMGISNSIESAFDIQDELDRQKVAHKLVAKWFNRKEDGSFDMNLIAERGYYNASEMEASIAAGTVRGMAALADAGEELIKNTFIVVTQLEFTANSNTIEKLGNVASALTGDKSIQSLSTIASNNIGGFYVGAPTYLFQLQWDETIANEFYESLWVDASSPDEERAKAFWDSYLFSLKLVGVQTDRTLVGGLKDGSSNDRFIKEATIRTVDKVYAKLQKNYNVFKPRVPLLSIDPYKAQIGKKEGLEGGERFEVLEQRVDKKTGRTIYVGRGTLIVKKDKVWDNRYSVVDESNSDEVRNFTKFDGKVKNAYPGMLIKQVK